MDFGEKLKKARESRDLTLQQVSSELKINLNVLKEIESSDANALPNRTSTKGFLKSYAQCLEIEAEPIIEDYLAKLEVKQTPVQESVLKDAIDPTPFFLIEFVQKRILPVIFLFIILGLGLVSYRYLSGADQILSNGLMFQAEDANIKKSYKKIVDGELKQVSEEAVGEILASKKDQDTQKTKDIVLATKETNLVIEPLAKTYAYYKDQSLKTAITLSLKPNSKRIFKFKEAEITFLDAGAVNLILNGKDIGSPGVFAERKTIEFPSLKGL